MLVSQLRGPFAVSILRTVSFAKTRTPIRTQIGTSLGEAA